eukprot:scaffold5738_cov75-Skeletonema_dohrnii-CCMP3373.AAC.2
MLQRLASVPCNTLDSPTPTPHPPRGSTSSNSSASPASKRLPSTYVDQPVPSRPHRDGRLRAQPGPLLV